jgi:hypothetical protein
MKVVALCVAGFCAGLVATSACAENLQLTPALPAIDQAFTIDIDYVTSCSGPIGDVVAVLRPPDPVFDFEHVSIASAIQCFDRVGTRVVHLSATLPGLAAGTHRSIPPWAFSTALTRLTWIRSCRGVSRLARLAQEPLRPRHFRRGRRFY